MQFITLEPLDKLPNFSFEHTLTSFLNTIFLQRKQIIIV